MSSTRTSNSDSWCTSVSRRLSVEYKRRVESRKFCHDFCSAISSPGISLAVRPAIRAAITSCYATHRLWNSRNPQVVAWRTCTPSSPSPPINCSGRKSPMSPEPRRGADQGQRRRRQSGRPAAGRRSVSAAAGCQRAARHGGLRGHRGGRRRGRRLVARARSLRFAGGRRIRRIRRGSRWPSSADPGRRRLAGRRRHTRGGMHGVVEPGDDGSSEPGPAGPDPRRRQRRGKPRHPGGPGIGRPGGGHRGFAGQAGTRAANWAPRSPSTTATRTSSRGCGRQPTARVPT